MLQIHTLEVFAVLDQRIPEVNETVPPCRFDNLLSSFCLFLSLFTLRGLFWRLFNYFLDVMNGFQLALSC